MVTTRSRTSYAEMPLHEILQLDEGAQTDALMQFYEEGQTDPSKDTVLIKTNSGAAMHIPMGKGQKISIMPKGRRVSRRLAVRLLREYGYRGKYWGRERTTGIRKIDLPRVPQETRERIQWYNPDVNFDKFEPNMDYLIHVPDTGLAEELEELAQEDKK